VLKAIAVPVHAVRLAQQQAFCRMVPQSLVADPFPNNIIFPLGGGGGRKSGASGALVRVPNAYKKAFRSSSKGSFTAVVLTAAKQSKLVAGRARGHNISPQKKEKKKRCARRAELSLFLEGMFSLSRRLKKTPPFPERGKWGL
jgi:hypothetical protein